MSNFKKALVALILLGVAAGAGFTLSASLDRGAVHKNMNNTGVGNEFDG